MTCQLKSKAYMESHYTKRVVSPELEDILYKEYSVLDHGFVRLIDYMGSDEAIVQAARVSYGKGTKHLKQDSALINYLMLHSHTTPFEMCEIKFHVKLPIFVARQWIRHRTANVNEYSARYSLLEKEFYVPKSEHIAKQSTTNTQGRDELLDSESSQEFIDSLSSDSSALYEKYEVFLKEGLSRELARINLSLNYYTQMYWKIDLHNLLHFIKLRSDNHAQYEIRAYSDIMLEILKKWVPLTYNAFVEYSLKASNISRSGLILIKKMIDGSRVSFEETNLTKREWNYIMESLDYNDRKIL